MDHWEVNELIDSVTQKRKKVPKVIENFYKRALQKELQALDELQFSSSPISELNKEVSNLMELLKQIDFNDSPQDLKKLEDHYNLLYLLRKKRECPISRIIDSI